MPNEPLIFVEVALTKDIPERIDNVLALNRDTDAASAGNDAVFYSISNCQSGLAGISFGNFLIKRVAGQCVRNCRTCRALSLCLQCPG